MQQVNLYTEDLRPKQDLLALPNMVAIVVAVLVLGTGYSLWQYWDLTQNRRLLAEWEEKNSILTQEVKSIEMQLAARRQDKRLELENDRLRLRLRNTQGLLDAIASGIDEKGNRIAFADVMYALAKHRIDPIWLQQIKILAGGERIVLSGETLQPEAVPVYLQALGQEAAFSGRAFNEFSLKLSEGTDKGVRQFVVDTKAENALDGEDSASLLRLSPESQQKAVAEMVAYPGKVKHDMPVLSMRPARG